MAYPRWPVTEPFVPLEPLLNWNNYEYGKCKILMRYGYKKCIGARHLVSKGFTYAETEDELIEVLHNAHLYEATPYEMPNVKLSIILKIRMLTAAYPSHDSFRHIGDTL